MDVNSGESVKIFGDTAGVRGYNYIASVSSNGKFMIIFQITSNSNDDLYLLDLNSLEYSKLTDDDHDVIYDSPTLMPDNKTIWLTCNDNEEGISRIATITVGSPEVAFVDDGWIDPKWEVDGLEFSRDFKYMTAVTR